VDRDWAVEGTQRSVKYGALPPGDYRFRVMTRDSDEGWNVQEAALGLVIVPRVWELKWVRFTAGFVLLGGIVLAVRQVERGRSRHKLAAVERERALERERSRIGRDIHDDLGACLTRVALLGDMTGDAAASPEELRTQTRQMSEAAREMVQSLQAIVWAVRPQNDTLRSLIDYMDRRTEDLFEKMPRQYRFTMPASLPECPLHAELRHNVFLAYKEALTNTLKHARATTLRIDVTCDPEACRIAIAVNGTGFAPAHARVADSGLRHMHQRMEEIGGDFKLHTQPEHGTTVQLIFPLRHQPQP
jgi:signal transduction histidine kinase